MTDLAPRPAAAPAPSAPLPLALSWLLLGLGATAVAVALAGAAPEQVPDGLPDPGPVPGWSLPLVRLVGHAAVVGVVAALLAALLAGRRVAPAVVVPAVLLWSASSVGALLLGLAEVVGRPVHRVLEPELLSYYVAEVPQGRAVLLSALLALAVLVPPARRVPGQLAALLLVAAAIVPPLLAGHAAGAGSHRTAQVSLVLHVLAAVVWVAGVAALALLPPDADLGRLAARFSPLALGCAVLVAASGLVGARLRVDLDGLASGYGALLLLKTAALLALVGVGRQHRRRTLPALAAGAPGALRRLAAGEVGLMAVALGLAAALARTPSG